MGSGFQYIFLYEIQLALPPQVSYEPRVSMPMKPEAKEGFCGVYHYLAL